MKRLIEFLFCRNKWEIIKRGEEEWTRYMPPLNTPHIFKRDYVDYKITNKFSGSTKMKRKYLN